MGLVLAASGLHQRAWAEIDWEKEREFWSFQPPVLPALPTVKNEGWGRNGIDRFILRRLEEEGHAPQPEAPREVLLPRLALDLTGLPPSLEQLEGAAGADPEDAYQAFIDELLASPRYGERLASFWMPIANYSEDQPVGRRLHFPGAHYYRQWVIDAFNRDLPYDEFVRKQLAADLLGEDDHRATGFLALGPYPPAGSRIEQRADMWADRVDTVSRSLLGLSVACARCHDHLDDPITAEDYYAFAGIIASTDLDERWIDMKEIHVVTDAVLRNFRVFEDGDPDKPGKLVPRRNIRLLSDEPNLEAYQNGSGRGELAREITSRSNPLVARVMVNRIWGEVMGRHLVATPSNFGHSGERPTHPELLDYLAVQFMENGWSIKWLVRELVTSATYRQRSVMGNSPGLELYAGMPRRRLTAEMIRDSMLAAAGTLVHEGEGSADLDDPHNLRRTVFGEVRRTALDSFLRDFDYPEPTMHIATREVSVTPGQKLFLLNSEFVMKRSGELANGLQLNERDPAIGLLFQRVLSRPPTPAERSAAEAFLDADTGSRPIRRWERLVQVLFSSNSFLYRD